MCNGCGSGGYRKRAEERFLRLRLWNILRGFLELGLQRWCKRRLDFGRRLFPETFCRELLGRFTG